MKYVLIQITLLSLLLLLTSCTLRYNECIIYSTQTGKKLSLKKLVSELVHYDVVLFGEFHGHTAIHNLQEELLPLYIKEAIDIAISMEMFERDVQPIIDNYLIGKIEEEEFLEKSRPWHTYRLDYRPIIELAKKQGVPVIAANVPRKYASQVSRFGIEWLKEVPYEDRFLMAEAITLTEDSYRDRFFSTMIDSPHILTHSHLELNEQLNNLYAAQSLKDDTMAESIYQYHQKYPNVKIIHFQGDFHSNSRLGVYTKLLLRNPNLSVAVISPVVLERGQKSVVAKNMKNVADYLVVVKE